MVTANVGASDPASGVRQVLRTRVAISAIKVGEAVRRRTVGEAMGHRLIVSRRRTRGHPSSTDKSVAGGANM